MLINVDIVSTNGTIPVDVDGNDVDTPVVIMQVAISKSDLEALDALYDPTSATSPPAADGRPIPRAILDAWRAR